MANLEVVPGLDTGGGDDQPLTRKLNLDTPKTQLLAASNFVRFRLKSSETGQIPEQLIKDLPIAIETDDAAEVDSVLGDSSAKLINNIRTEDDMTLLMFAASSGATTVCSLLVCKLVSLDATDMHGDTALYYAAKGGHTPVLHILLDAGAAVDKWNKSGDTALLAASQMGHSDAIELLIGHGAQINATNEEGNTPLLLACRNSMQDTALELIERGAHVKQVAKDGITALDAAADANMNIVCERILVRQLFEAIDEDNSHNGIEKVSAQGLPVASLPPFGPKSPCLYALVNGKLGAYWSLIKAGATFKIPPNTVYPVEVDDALATALRAGNLELADSLLEGGAVPSVKSVREGDVNRLLRQAVATGRSKCVANLVKDRIAPDRKTKEREAEERDLLYTALTLGHEETATVLLGCSRSLDLLSYRGPKGTPLHVGVAQNFMGFVNHPTVAKLVEARWKQFGIYAFLKTLLMFAVFVMLVLSIVEQETPQTSHVMLRNSVDKLLHTDEWGIGFEEGFPSFKADVAVWWNWMHSVGSTVDNQGSTLGPNKIGTIIRVELYESIHRGEDASDSTTASAPSIASHAILGPYSFKEPRAAFNFVAAGSVSDSFHNLENSEWLNDVGAVIVVITMENRHLDALSWTQVLSEFPATGGVVTQAQTRVVDLNPPALFDLNPSALFGQPDQTPEILLALFTLVYGVSGLKVLLNARKHFFDFWSWAKLLLAGGLVGRVFLKLAECAAANKLRENVENLSPFNNDLLAAIDLARLHRVSLYIMIVLIGVQIFYFCRIFRSFGTSVIAAKYGAVALLRIVAFAFLSLIVFAEGYHVLLGAVSLDYMTWKVSLVSVLRSRLLSQWDTTGFDYVEWDFGALQLFHSFLWLLAFSVCAAVAVDGVQRGRRVAQAEWTFQIATFLASIDTKLPCCSGPTMQCFSSRQKEVSRDSESNKYAPLLGRDGSSKPGEDAFEKLVQSVHLGVLDRLFIGVCHGIRFVFRAVVSRESLALQAKIDNTGADIFHASDNSETLLYELQEVARGTHTSLKKVEMQVSSLRAYVEDSGMTGESTGAYVERMSQQIDLLYQKKTNTKFPKLKATMKAPSRMIQRKKQKRQARLASAGTSA